MTTLNVLIGTSIEQVAQQMVATAKNQDNSVDATFNGILLLAYPNFTTPSSIVKFYYQECEKRAEAWRASPEGQQVLKEREEARKRHALAAREPLRPFSFKNADAADGWKRNLAANTDRYGAAVNRYAARWANIMETQLHEGKTVAEIAEVSEHEADTEGITGAMNAMARSLLYKVWTYGDELRDWYTKR